MKPRNIALAVNSILIIVTTTLLGTMLHELAHYLTAGSFGIPAVLHHNYVDYPDENATEVQRAIIAGAGPLFSLISGIVFLLISIKIKKPSLFKLFMLWFGMNGILMFMGYLLIAPIAANGDSGKVFAFWHIPTYASILIAALSFAAIIYLFTKLSSQFRFYKTRDEFNQSQIAKQLFLYPIFSSIIIVTLLNLPVVTWVSLLPTIFMPMTYFCTMGGYKKLRLNDAPLKISHQSIALIVLTIITIFVFRNLV